jgi:maleylacetoacetate isomerase
MNRRQLYTFHSSSTSFRVRIALNLKKVPYEAIPVTLRWRGGDNEGAAFAKVNPQRNVPVLVDGDVTVSQSLAILDYLDRVVPEPPLFPQDDAGRARVLAIALAVACDIQPLNNLGVERYLTNVLGLSADATRAWRRHWIKTGLDALEQVLAGSSNTGAFCHGEQPTAADCCLVPQAYNARLPMVGFELGQWPTIAAIYARCLDHPAFVAALPENQPDFAPLE